MVKPNKNYTDFLRDDLFIYWRLHPTKELDRFWEEFILQNEKLEEPFNRAVEAFEAIRDRHGTLEIGESTLLQKLQSKITSQQKRRKALRIFTASAAAIFVL